MVNEINGNNDVEDSKAKGTKSTSKFSDRREAITHILLKQYRTLAVFGIRFTWLGIHKIQGRFGCL